MRTARYGAIATMIFFMVGSLYGQTQLAGWTFDALTASPNTPTSVLANIGAQSSTAGLYADGTNGSSSWLQASELNSFGGSTTNDPRGGSATAGSAYCPLGGTSLAANGKAIVLKFSMTGYTSPILTYATRNTSTGFNTQQWAYSTDGSSFTNTTTITGITTSFATKTVDLSAVTELNNATTVYLRVTFTGASSATGNNRIDNIIINATAPINDGDGTATLLNAIGSGVLDATTIFNKNVSGQSVKVSVTGSSAGTLSKISIVIPSEWTWTGSASDVAPSGDDAASLTGEVISGDGTSGTPWTISYDGSVTNANLGKVTISNLTTPNPVTITDNGNYTFTVKTAKSGGTLTSITNGSPKAYVIIPLANVRNQSGGIPVLNSTFVASSGVVTLANSVLTTTQLQGYIQSGDVGINIFFNGAPPTFTEGNEYIVLGQVTQFAGNTEIVPSSTSNIINNGASTPVSYTVVTAANLVANPEDYEGRYIAVQNVTLTSGTWPATAGSSGTSTTLVFTSGSSFNVLVDNDTDVDGNTEPSWPKDIKGIFIQSASTPTYVLTLRTFAGDIAAAGALPVELISFTAVSKGRGVELAWKTATEVNNAGFEIQRSEVGGQWSKVGFVEGNGTTNAPKSYSFVDASAKGTVSYRLKQIDRDGQFEYSSVVNATVAMTAADYELSQNFPNPFNPNTNITFAMKTAENVNVTVYNSLGQAVATLFNDIANANQVYTLSFDGKNLSSGTYFYALRSASRNEVRKMLLSK